jgi:hypothetical protein
MQDRKKSSSGTAAIVTLLLALMLAAIGCEEVNLFSDAANTDPDTDIPTSAAEMNTVIATNPVDVLIDGTSTNGPTSSGGTNDPPADAE